MTSIAAPRLETDRLELVPLRVEHADEMVGVLADPALHTFIGGAPADAVGLRSRYERMTAGSPDPAVSWLNWVLRLREDSRLVGTVQATVSPSEDGPVAEIAWVVGTAWQQFATEAARALVDWLVRLPVHSVVAHVHPEHRASAAVAAAAGLWRTEEEQDGEIRWRLVVPAPR